MGGAIVLWYMIAILRFVCLNRLVILRVWERKDEGCPFRVVFCVCGVARIILY